MVHAEVRLWRCTSRAREGGEEGCIPPQLNPRPSGRRELPDLAVERGVPGGVHVEIGFYFENDPDPVIQI